MKRPSKKNHQLDDVVNRLKIDVTKNVKSISKKVENIDFQMKDIESKIGIITQSVDSITNIRGE